MSVSVRMGDPLQLIWIAGYAHGTGPAGRLVNTADGGIAGAGVKGPIQRRPGGALACIDLRDESSAVSQCRCMRTDRRLAAAMSYAAAAPLHPKKTPPPGGI